MSGLRTLFTMPIYSNGPRIRSGRCKHFSRQLRDRATQELQRPRVGLCFLRCLCLLRVRVCVCVCVLVPRLSQSTSSQSGSSPSTPSASRGLSLAKEAAREFCAATDSSLRQQHFLYFKITINRNSLHYFYKSILILEYSLIYFLQNILLVQ